MVLLGVAAAALLSLVFMLFSLADQWQGQPLANPRGHPWQIPGATPGKSQGQIVEIKKERVRVHRDKGDWWENQTFAHVRQPNGRIRKMRAMSSWQVGDQLEKRRGETHIRMTR